MLKYIGKRLLMMIPILLGIMFIVLILIDVTPGDPARIVAGSTATPEEYAKVRADLKLDDPFIVRFANFIKGACTLDFGTSFITKTEVWEDIKIRFPFTLVLGFASTILAVVIGLPLGIVAATNQNTWKDALAVFFSLICSAMPSFWLALMLVQLFSVKLRWLPVYGIENWTGWIMPIMSLALGYAAGITRLTRSSMLEVIRSDYITTARAKGCKESTVIYRHALKNAVIPVVMTVGSLFGMALGGALVTETIFSLPGLGQYSLTGLTNRDYPVIQATTLYLSVIFSVVILVIDVLFAFIDPRIRSQYIRSKGKKKANTKQDDTNDDNTVKAGA